MPLFNFRAKNAAASTAAVSAKTEPVAAQFSSTERESDAPATNSLPLSPSPPPSPSPSAEAPQSSVSQPAENARTETDAAPHNSSTQSSTRLSPFTEVPSDAAAAHKRLSASTIGIVDDSLGESDEHDDLRHVRRVRIANSKDPLAIENAFQELVDCVETLTIKSRDNDAIFFQMLRSMEERLVKRIDMVKDEVLREVDEKIATALSMSAAVQGSAPFAVSATAVTTSNNNTRCVSPSSQSQSSYGSMALMPPPTAGGMRPRNSLYKNSLSNHSLSVLFETADETAASPVQQQSQSQQTVGHSQFVVNGRGSFSVSHNAVSQEPTVQYENTTITPRAGFVIKTKKLTGQKDKVFVNVFHHELIELIPAALPAREREKAMENLPFAIFGEVSNSLDKEGLNCVTYNVGVSSELFKQPSEVDFSITAPASIQKIIHKINIYHKEFLDESTYSLPRLATGYKGDSIPQLVVPTVMKPAPVEESQVQKEKEKECLREEREETGSVAMSTTAQSTTGTKRRLTRKSIFDTSGHAINEGNYIGRNMLSSEMLEYIREECVDGKTAQSLKDASIENPLVLLGWQIQYTNDFNSEELYVVTDVRKNLLNRTEFRLSKFYAEDTWVRLKRSADKPGNEFRPMRKVLFGLQDDDDTIVSSQVR